MKNKTYKIVGTGDSLWGKSDGVFTVNEISLTHQDDDIAPEFCEIQMFGTDTKWLHYTDRGIEKEVNRKEILDYCKSLLPGNKDKTWKLCWSEQGMQPRAGWSFDFFVVREERKS